MNAYLIDPFTQTITQVEHDGKIDNIYAMIGAELFDCATFNEHYDGVFVDDEGLYKTDQAFFRLHRNNELVLAGKGLVLGCDAETGESRSPIVSLDEMKKLVDFVQPVRIGGRGTAVFVPAAPPVGTP